MKFICTLLFICITQFTFAQDYNFKSKPISHRVMKQVNILKTHDVFHDDAIGYSGYKSDTYSIFENIFENASINEWIELCKHPKPIIRYYAFYALEKHKVTTEILTPIVLNHLNDTAQISTLYGCLGEEEIIGDFMFSSIEDEYKQSITLKKQIDSLFLYAKGPLISRANTYLENLPKTETLRKRLQNMVRYENNKYALDILLSYNNPEDWTYIKYLIKSHPLTALKGIAKYPKKEFIADLQWWKTDLSHPYRDDFSWETHPQDHSIIWAVYKAYMNYEPAIRNANFTDIFNTYYSNEVKHIHASMIYSILVNNTEEWTNPIKLTILPYLSECNKEYIDLLASQNPNKSVDIFKYMTTRYYPYMGYNSECSQAIITQLLKTYNKDSIEFLRTELQKDLTPPFFLKYYNTLTTLTHGKEEEVLIYRLKQKLKTEEIELSDIFIYLLNDITDLEIKKEIWWICYHHIQKNNGTPIRNLLKVMDIYNPEQTQTLAQDLFLKQNLKSYVNWGLFNYLNNKNQPELKEWLIRIYSQMPHSFKTSKLGIYMKKEMFPNQDW